MFNETTKILENQIELYKIAAAYLHGFKKSKLKILLKRTGGLNSIFEETYSNLHFQTGLAISTIQKMKRETALRKAQLNFEFNRSHYIRSVFLNDDTYPLQLKECKDGPIQLNVLGQTCLKNKKLLSRRL